MFKVCEGVRVSHPGSEQPEDGPCGAWFWEALEAQEVQEGPWVQGVLEDQHDLHRAEGTTVTCLDMKINSS